MNKIICFGSAGKDIFFPTNEGKIIETPEDIMSQKKVAYELGAKIRIKERYEMLGGCAANVAVGLSRLGVESSCVSNVGDDLVGNWVIEELEKNNIKTDFIKKEEGKMSDLSAIIVDEKSADRIIFTNKNSSGKLNLDKDRFGEAEWFFISDVHGDWKEQVSSIIEIAKAENKKIAFNPREVYIKENSEEVIKTISNCEIVFVNKDEAIEIISSMERAFSVEEMNDEKFLIKELKKLGAKIIILTDGENGAWANKETEIFYAAAFKVNAIDSTGAGDGFCSGFLAAYLKRMEVSDCLRWGITNSASVVEHYGAIEGLLNEESILEKNKEVKINQL
ncbi:MAG: carbohydrate kinase family protein [Candidatus Moraniibacteriota bacterium]